MTQNVSDSRTLCVIVWLTETLSDIILCDCIPILSVLILSHILDG